MITRVQLAVDSDKFNSKIAFFGRGDANVTTA